MTPYSKIVIHCKLKMIFQYLVCLLAAVALSTFVKESATEGFYLSKDDSVTNIIDFRDLVDPKDNDNLEEYIHSKEEEDRIVGGEVAQSWDFMAFVYWYQEDLLKRLTPSCSATVITNQWLLTAASCLPEDFEEVFVRLGCRNITS